LFAVEFSQLCCVDDYFVIHISFLHQSKKNSSPFGMKLRL